MPKAPKDYTRLPGRGLRYGGFRLFSRAICTLWMGADHLLLVDRTGYTESYKRFYFADIQAIVVRRTSFSNYDHGSDWKPCFGILCVGLQHSNRSRTLDSWYC